MPTPYSKVFSVFLAKITDSTYSNMTQEDAEEDMIDLLNIAVTNFEYPKVDIRDKDDFAKQFNLDLSLDEINILGNLMILEWIDRKVNNTKLLKQYVSSKDFRLTSQANHLESLLELKSKTEKYVSTLKRKYSYRKTGSLYYIPDFSGLGGE